MSRPLTTFLEFLPTSLFTNLRRLCRADHFPDEDFLTEIVFGFIQRHPDKFIAWLQRVGATDFPITSDLSGATQFHSAESLEDRLPAKRPDMVVWLRKSTGEQVLFIESKVGSPLSGEDQLQQYARILSKLPTQALKTLLFITRDYLPQDCTQLFEGIDDTQRPRFIQTRWHEFAAFLNTQPHLGKDTLTYRAPGLYERTST